jgi:hypothetical protein
MATEEIIHAPHLGEHGEPCSVCGAPLAGDQRYCLNCGERRADARIPFMDILRSGSAAPPPADPPAQAAAEPPPPERNGFGFNPLTLGVGVLCVVLLFGLGFLIGRTGQKTPKPVAQKAPVVNVTAGSTGGQTAQTTFTEDWPQGKDGYTVQLQVLPKSSTQPDAVNTAKTDATTKGATDVGALDSDQHSSLDPGNYVIYSGVFDDQKQAKAALKNLRASFPDAQVVQVSAAGSSASGSGDANAAASSDSKATNPKLKELQSASGKDYAKKSAKLPDKVNTGGKAPPKDNKAAGGDSSDDATVIK